MPKAVTETWNWPTISKQLQAATIETINEATEEGAQDAKSNVRVKTGDLRDSIRSERAEVTGDVITGAFGSYGQDASLYAAAEEVHHAYIRPAADRLVERLALVMKAKTARIK